MTDHTEGLPELPPLTIASGAIGVQARDVEPDDRMVFDDLSMRVYATRYGEACAKAARAEAASWEKQASDRLDDALRFAREADEWKAKALVMEWVSVEDAVPKVGQEVLVFGKSPWESAPSIKVDRWDEIHESPVSFSSATICVGEGWTENDDSDITHWMPLPPPPTQPKEPSNG